MDNKNIKHITNNHYKKIKYHIEMVEKGFDVEAIHQLRVEYKKLRAFFRMLSQVKNAQIKVSKNLKQYYNASGAVRDLQLQQQRVLNTTKGEPKKPQAYLNLLQREIDKLKPELIEISSANPVAESKNKTDGLLPDKFSIGDFRKSAEQKWAAVYTILASGHFSDDNIHAIRKIFKDLFYNIKEYYGVEHEILSVGTWEGKDEKYFDTLLNELGNFQDHCTSIALLKIYWLNNLNTYNRELLEKIKEKWIKDKISLKQALIKKLKTEILFQKRQERKTDVLAL